MKNTNPLRRYYDRLTAAERVNLFLGAQDRHDEAEMHALLETCPLKECLKCEGRLLALGHVAALLVNQLLACEVFIVHRFADLTAQPAADSDLDRSMQALLERQAAVWRGFVAWCQDVGHDPHQVMLLAPMGSDDHDPAFFVLHQAIEQIEAWASDPCNPLVAPDKVETWHDLFTGLFRPVASESR
jgi:hypothetical protein